MMTTGRIKAGILTFSDGRRYIHESLAETNLRYQRRLADALREGRLGGAGIDVLPTEPPGPQEAIIRLWREGADPRSTLSSPPTARSTRRQGCWRCG